MSTAGTKDNAPELLLSLELNKSLAADFRPDDIENAIPKAVEHGVADLLQTLGIPGSPRLELKRVDEDALSTERLMRFSVNGRSVRFPDDVLLYTHSYVTGTYPHPDTRPAGIADWLCKVESTRLTEFFTLTCVEILKGDPASLLDLPRAKAYLNSLTAPAGGSSGETPAWPPDIPFVYSVLSHVLSLRLSIADRQTVAGVLHKGWVAARAPEDVAEDLIETLSPAVLEIQLPLDDLRKITTRWENSATETFPFLRDGLFAELGVTYPRFRFVPVEHLKPNSFALKVNHLETLPMLLLAEQECLVNDTSERLKDAYSIKIQARPALNPASGQPGSLIDLRDQATAETLGLTAWNQMQFLILSLAAFLRKYGYCLVHCSLVKEQFDQLELVFPEVVKAARDRMSGERVTRILRQLVREEVSIRNLRRILELLLDYGLIAGDSPRAADDHPHDEPAEMLAFVRAGLRNEIGYKRAAGTQTVVVYVVDEQIERIVAERPFSELREEADRILEALRTELDYLRRVAPTAKVPNVLITREARPALQALIRSEFPRIFIIAHDELPPSTNVQPVARVSLSA